MPASTPTVCAAWTAARSLSCPPNLPAGLTPKDGVTRTLHGYRDARGAPVPAAAVIPVQLWGERIEQDTVGGQRAATPGARLACKGGESATGFGDYGHERSHVVDLQVGFGGYVDGAFGDQHVGPEVPVGP